MDTQKLKMKIGVHEFEAEGPVEIVQAQFAAFKELIASLPSADRRGQQSEQTQETSTSSTAPLDKIMKVEGRIVSLTARSNSLEDGILLVALGQKTFRNNDAITGGEIIDGLKLSGHPVTRIDRYLDKFAGEGLLIKIGSGRGSRYRLTHQGLAKAQETAKGVIALVP